MLALVVIGGVLYVTTPWAPKIEVVEPGPGGERITDDGMLANYYPAEGAGSHSAVLVIGGSEGGLNPLMDDMAREIRDAGHTTLALSYWGAEGQPEPMEELPLESFTTALDWLSARPEVDPERIGMLGVSKGGEATLLMASRDPRISAAVGYVPSHVVWPGIDMLHPWKMMGMGSTWSEGGQPVPFLPYTDEFRGGTTADFYQKSLDALPQHPEAEIPVEEAEADMLLICGEEDTLWPGCPMARAAQKRSETHDGPGIEVLAYPDAGHIMSGPPITAQEAEDRKLTQMGGTPQGIAAARTDAWPKVLDFLDAELG